MSGVGPFAATGDGPLPGIPAPRSPCRRQPERTSSLQLRHASPPRPSTVRRTLRQPRKIFRSSQIELAVRLLIEVSQHA